MNNKQEKWLSLRPSEAFQETGVREFLKRRLRARLGRCRAVRETRENLRRFGVTGNEREAPSGRLSPGAHEPAGAGAGVFSVLEDRRAGNQGRAVAVDPLDEAAEPTCGGVAMPLRLFSSDGAMDAKIGGFVVDGSLFQDGKNTCQAVHIACFKATGSCETAIAVMIFEKDRYPRILGIFISDEIKISRWTNNEIVAAGQTHLCKWSQLFVNYTTNKIRLIETSGSGPGCAGGPVINVLDVETDPLYLQRAK